MSLVESSPFSYHPSLRARLAAHLAAFEIAPRLPDPALKRAAVALAVLTGDTGDEAAVILTRRASKMRAHAGQWALPGGRLDPGETPVEAALRELEEEIGLTVAPGDVLGVLDDYPTRSGYLISPVVVWAPADAPLVPNAAEVASVHRIPLSELDRPDSPEFVPIPESDRPVLRMPIFDTHINAPTAAMLYQFREVAMHGRAVRVDMYEQPVFAWR